jgi:hypothetical protein
MDGSGIMIGKMVSKKEIISRISIALLVFTFAKQHDAFEPIPLELKIEIFRHLDLGSVQIARLVCKAWSKNLREDQLWKMLFIVSEIVSLSNSI